MVKNYLLLAYRNLQKWKTSSAINIIGLSIGISVCLSITNFTSFEFSFEDFHVDKERIYRVVEDFRSPSGKDLYSGYTYGPLKATLDNGIKAIEESTSIYCYYGSASISNKKTQPVIFNSVPYPVISNVVLTDTAYFRLFKYSWISGNPSTALADPFKVVLTESEANRYFGFHKGDNIIGKEITYYDENDTINVTVSGVIADLPKNSDLTYTDFISIGSAKRGLNSILIGLNSWNGLMIAQTFVKISKGAKISNVEDQMSLLVKQNLPNITSSKLKLSLQPLTSIHFDTQYEDGNNQKTSKTFLYILLVSAFFVLLIAIINYVNLTTAQAIHRVKEISVRKVLGASRSNLTIQLFYETAILVLLATTISILFVYPTILMFPKILPVGIKLNLKGPNIYIITLGIAGITIFLAAFYPAIFLSSNNTITGLKGSLSNTVGSKSFIRKALISFQIACSIFFIVGSLIVGKQVNFLLSKDMGFSRSNILILKTDVKFFSSNKSELLAQNIRNISGVEDVCRSSGTPLMNHNNVLNIKCSEKKINLSVRSNIIDERFIPFYRIKLIAGRNVAAPGNNSLAEFIINRTYASLLGFSNPKDAIGSVLETSFLRPMIGPIVGVVEDFNTESLHTSIPPAVLIGFNDMRLCLSVKINPNDMRGSQFNNILGNLQGEWKAIFPENRFESTILEENIDQLYLKEKTTSKTMSTIMIVSVLICCGGLLGMINYITERRIKEIAIRKVLGASILKIVTVLLTEFFTPFTIAIAIAFPLAFYLSGLWLEHFAYRIELNILIFIEAALILMVIGFAVISIKILKAAFESPARSLRSE